MNSTMRRLFASLVFGLLSVAPAFSAEALKVVTLPYPPYQYEENGALKGFVAAIVEETFRRMNQPITIEVYPFARAIEMVREGSADAIFTAAKNAEREAFADFPGEVLVEQKMSLFVATNSSRAFDGDLRKLRQYQIGVINGFRYGNVFDDAVNNGVLPNIDAAYSPEGNAKKLIAGRIDYWMSNREQALFTIRALGLSNAIKELSPPVQVIPSYLAFSKKRNLGAVREKFDSELRKMKADGTYEKIVAQYWKPAGR